MWQPLARVVTWTPALTSDTPHTHLPPARTSAPATSVLTNPVLTNTALTNTALTNTVLTNTVLTDTADPGARGPVPGTPGLRTPAPHLTPAKPIVFSAQPPR